MSAFNEDYWFPWYPVHFERDTLHLSMAAEGAYRRLIDRYMLHGTALPADDRSLCRLLGCAMEEWLAVASEVRAMFVECGGRLHKNKCDELLQAQANQTVARSKVGKTGAKARWNKKKLKNASGNAIPMPAAENSDASGNAETMPNDAKGEERIEDNLPPTPQGEDRDGGESPKPAEDLRPKPTGKPWLALIQEFDAARIDVFGANQARPYPHANDSTDAPKWWNDGITAELAGRVFRYEMAKRPVDDIPQSLRSLEKSVYRAMRQADRPAPETGGPIGRGPVIVSASSLVSREADELRQSRMRLAVEVGFTKDEAFALIAQSLSDQDFATKITEKRAAADAEVDPLGVPKFLQKALA